MHIFLHFTFKLLNRELIEKGLQVKEEGVIEVALASISIPASNVPLADEANQILKDMLVSQEITVELPIQENGEVTNDSIEQLFGYVSFSEGDVTYLVQDLLLSEGLAFIDQSTPALTPYVEKLKEIADDVK